MNDTREVTVVTTSFLHTMRRDAGLPPRLALRVPECGVSAREIAVDLGLPPDRIEGVFHNLKCEGLDTTIIPGDRVAFIPYGTPTAHPAFFGGFRS
jgi:hypothetical protein